MNENLVIPVSNLIYMSTYQNYPNVFRVAQELSRCKHPDKVLGALQQLLESKPGILQTAARTLA